uniref:Uncharacterized protein n=1 Tax=Romanomermis culicivorax TaxID=13658 RepID=A0A915IA45_ROMCU
MDDVVVIMEILKYFNFEELCIAERINANFKSCVQSELRRLRYIDLDRIFTYSWMDVINKIQAHCSGLRHLKNFNSVTSFMVKKRWWDLPDPFIEEDFEDNFFIPLPGLEKLACLEFDLKFIEVFGWKYTLNLVENARRLEQLSAAIHANKIFNNEVEERICKFIIGHSALRKLEIIQHNGLLIDLASCRNLTHFSLTLYGRMLSADYEQLYALLDVNLNLVLDVNLNLATVEIATQSRNLPLMEKLMRLPKLKSLLLHISGDDSNLPYHRFIKDLYFASLQNIRASPLQTANKQNLHWSSKDAAALKKMSCNSSLQGIDLDNNSASPASLDLILDQCPNLHYFRVDRLNGQEIRKLPLKVPKLEYFQLCYHISKTIPVTVDDLTYLVENLPNLRQLCIPDKLYELLLFYKKNQENLLKRCENLS